MIEGWFKGYSPEYNDFVRALLEDGLEAMNEYMNGVAFDTFSNFDAGRKPLGRTQPECFYHGFVLGLMVDLADRYTMTSNHESGFGRYDVMLESVKATGINTNSVMLCMVNMMKKLIFKGETKDGRIRKQ